MEQDQYEEDIKVVILPDRQEVTSEDLTTMPDVVRERVRYCFVTWQEKCYMILQINYFFWLCFHSTKNQIVIKCRTVKK